MYTFGNIFPTNVSLIKVSLMKVSLMQASLLKASLLEASLKASPKEHLFFKFNTIFIKKLISLKYSQICNVYKLYESWTVFEQDTKDL